MPQRLMGALGGGDTVTGGVEAALRLRISSLLRDPNEIDWRPLRSVGGGVAERDGDGGGGAVSGMADAVSGMVVGASEVDCSGTGIGCELKKCGSDGAALHAGLCGVDSYLPANVPTLPILVLDSSHFRSSFVSRSSLLVFNLIGRCSESSRLAGSSLWMEVSRCRCIRGRQPSRERWRFSRHLP